MNAWFVTGTDTEIGKSLCSAALLHAFTAQGHRVAGMKPIAAGAALSGDRWHNDDVDLITAASNVVIAPELVCPYLLKEPVAPHIAAAAEGMSFDLDHIEACLEQLRSQAEITIVESVGGFRVPLSDTQDTADLALELDLPLILVVGMRLGCISHTLLTVEAIQARGLRLAGWIANQIDPGMRQATANLEALRARIAAPLLGHIPHLVPADPRIAAEHLNLDLLT